MWNPFRRYTIQPQESAIVAEELDNVIKPETERALLQSLRARNEVTSIYERLSGEALHDLRGGKPCLP